MSFADAGAPQHVPDPEADMHQVEADAPVVQLIEQEAELVRARHVELIAGLEIQHEGLPVRMLVDQRQDPIVCPVCVDPEQRLVDPQDQHSGNGFALRVVLQ